MTERDGEPRADAPVVLIAEDEEPIALALAMIIEDFGYAVVVATNGRDALAVARAKRPALIITDLMMPLMGGAALIAALRADAAQDGHQAPPVVLMSAAGRHYMDPVGADDILPKPFEMRQIEALLARYLPQP
ncbi:MAG TPA: response regulator [Ktedonobacterales bacterium]|nr:response regulator [Ktedonobacterales bacterium]